MSRRNFRPMVLLLPTIVVHLALLLSLGPRLLTSFDVYSIYSQNYQCDLQRPWSSWDALFQVNAQSGSTAFGAAKTIDIVWDLGVLRYAAEEGNGRASRGIGSSRSRNL